MSSAPAAHRSPGASARAAWLAFAAVAGFSAAAGATRLLEQPEGAYETALADVALPRSAAGYVRFPPCAGCAPLTLSVTTSTAYFIERTPVSLAELAAAASDVEADGRAGDAAVYVFYDVESRRVNRLVLDRLAQ